MNNASKDGQETIREVGDMLYVTRTYRHQDGSTARHITEVHRPSGLIRVYLVFDGECSSSWPHAT